MSLSSTAIDFAERGLIPVPLVRAGIRANLRARLTKEQRRQRALDDWIRELRASDIALVPRLANQQHYEVPPAFFELVLGPALKYSGAYWPDGVNTLADAERAMLDLTMARADLRDGQEILELGCGWGSLTLAMARAFPNARVHAVSNSAPQREFILERARRLGLDRVTVETADMNLFDARRRFDRVVSVEMFEHMRNWPALLGRIHGWLRPDGALFVHVFSHARFAYPYDDEGDEDWMARHFFSGGMMPSDDLLPRVAPDLFSLDGHWQVDGTHYARTAEAWYALLVARRPQVLEVLERSVGSQEGSRTFHQWRIFFLACAELFAYRGGSEWIVSHYRLRPRALDR
jgi:cyclopropane-fatty-acyl-phospholipid synthase